MLDLTEIDKSWSGVNISKFSHKMFLISWWLSSCDFIKAGVIYSPGFIVNINRDIKMNIRTIFHNLISIPGNWQVRILYHLLARGQTDTKAQAGHHDQHCFYLSWREIRWYSIQCSVFACSQIILQTLRREKRLSNVALHWSTLVSRGAAGIIIPLSVYPGQGFYRN